MYEYNIYIYVYNQGKARKIIKRNEAGFLADYQTKVFCTKKAE